MNIYYEATETVDVIFNTDYTYIPRQQLALNGDVNFDGMDTPRRTGYKFAGWRYLKKDAKPDANGEYADNQYTELNKDNPSLPITTDLLNAAKIENSGGTRALHLYPKWEPNTTQVRVILWTEDLTGTDDVYAKAENGNTTYYDTKYKDYQNNPVTHLYTERDASYSNMGSFVVKDIVTDSSLKNGNDLINEIKTKVTAEFSKAMNGKDWTAASGAIDFTDFYTQAGFQIVHGEDKNPTTASADGKTTINVFFTRNVYELLFTYYGSATGYGNASNEDSDYCVAANTNGYSYGGSSIFNKNGDLNFGYSGNISYPNYWMRANVTSDAQMPVPKTITIRAKYGADLRDVWPVARSEEHFDGSLDNPGPHGTTAKMISWATTDGKYNETSNEKTIMGVYGAMGSEIIADPKQPVTYNADGNFATSGLRHNLVAYWFNGNISYYRNNHCYEIPDLDVTGNDVKKVSIYNTDTTNVKNVLYLVPTDNDAFTKYGFTDLMKVNEKGEADEKGRYYAVRQYTYTPENESQEVTKYYAIGRQVKTVSSNAIDKQNPSIRLHLSKVNTVADHSTQYADGRGAYNDTQGTVGTANDPYDLYFYYNRDRYTITYMAPCNNESAKATEVTLGKIELPYGTKISKDVYGFRLDYTKKNTDYNKWTTTGAVAVAVCPDRAENGTAEWKFEGWALDPAGVNMQWSYLESQPATQENDNFVLASHLRLYAIWEAPTYMVTFHLNGGMVNGGTKNIVENVPANRIYTSTENQIPRPVAPSTNKFVGWFVGNEKGEAIDNAGNVVDEPEKNTNSLVEFEFDRNITKNWDVVAVWNPPIENTFDYTVYYVTDKPLEADKSKGTVQIDDGKIVTTGGTQYYVLEKKVNTNVAITGTELNVTANNSLEAVKGYVPKNTNALLDTTKEGDKYVIFYYDPITNGKYTVQFVLAGTETGTKTVIKEQPNVKADQTVVTPKSAVVDELKAKGYALVNKNTNGDGYTNVEKATDLKWIDADGTAKGIATLTGNKIPATVTYLVQPIPYTITYKVADDTLAGAQDALNAITAAEKTPVANANGKNPTQYTNADTFIAKNPNAVVANGTVYRFSHWTLGTNTTEGNDTTKTYNPLKVDKGTVGNLTFVANWTAVTDTGSLTVTKTVAGNAGGTDREFNFTVTLGDKTINGTLGGMNFKNGVANFTLKHGESKTATGLPADITYKVEETEANQDGYTTTSTGETGTISKNTTATAAFTNTKNYTPATKYTLTYMDGDKTLDTTTHNYNDRVTLATDFKNGTPPIKEGFKFVGWYEDKDLKKPVTEVTMTSNKTVYAKWDKTETPGDLNGDDHFAYVIGYPDGTVRPEANITRAEIATIFFRLLKDDVRDKNLTDTNNFTDVPKDAWYNKAISTMAKLGIVNGYVNGSFMPDQPITRAELAKICDMFSKNPGGDSDFGTVFSDTDGHWAESYIAHGKELGWILGDAEANTFRPEDPITRAEAMAMINRVLNRLPEKKDDLLDGMNVWPDNTSDQWYYLYVQEATNSHDFKRKDKNSLYEKWTKLNEDPDWTQYQ